LTTEYVGSSVHAAYCGARVSDKWTRGDKQRHTGRRELTAANNQLILKSK